MGRLDDAMMAPTEEAKTGGVLAPLSETERKRLNRIAKTGGLTAQSFARLAVLDALDTHERKEKADAAADPAIA